MKEFLLFLPLTIIYLALKSTLFAAFPLPDSPLIMVFYLASRKAPSEGAFFAFVLGYLDDAFSGGILGTSSFALVFIFLSVLLLSKVVQFTTPAARAGGAGAAALVKGAAVYYVMRYSNVDAYFFTHVVLQALVTGFFAPPVISALPPLALLGTPRPLQDTGEFSA